MKEILTVATAIGLPMTSANADTPAEKPNEGLMMEQHEKNIEVLHAKFGCDWQGD